jgi:hypothetical protein
MLQVHKCVDIYRASSYQGTLGRSLWKILDLWEN